MINVVKRHNRDRKKVEQVMQMVKTTGGMEYAIKRMDEYHQKALDILSEFPDGIAKESLHKLSHYVISRNK